MVGAIEVINVDLFHASGCFRSPSDTPFPKYDSSGAFWASPVLIEEAIPRVVGAEAQRCNLQADVLVDSSGLNSSVRPSHETTLRRRSVRKNNRYDWLPFWITKRERNMN